MGSRALTIAKAIGSRGDSSLGSGTDDANSFLIASTSSLAAASAAFLAVVVFSSTSSASLFAFAAAFLASAPLILGVGYSVASAAVGLDFFFLPDLARFFSLGFFL